MQLIPDQEITIMNLSHTIASLAGKAIRPLRAGNSKLLSRRFQATKHPLRVMSPVFGEGEALLDAFAGPRAPSPPLVWQDAPAQVKEFVVVCEDPDAPFPSPFVHWIAYGIPRGSSELPLDVAKSERPEGVPGLKQGLNGAHEPGFTGAAPPAGHGVHHYHFQVFGLDAPLHLRKERPERDDILEAMRGHVIAFGETVATYEKE
jgi:Raf kinase inhibitor-like YbhB/YbcL family protein